MVEKTEEKIEADEELVTKKNVYHSIRFVQIICIGVFVFGFLWNTNEILNLTTPQFMMLYGGSGALISEVIARVFKKKILK